MTRRLNHTSRAGSIALAGICGAFLLSAGTAAGPSRAPQNQLSSPAEDTARINRLTSSGVRVEGDRITAWVSRDAMAADEIALLAARLKNGVEALESFLHLPRRWQDARQRRIEYFFDAGPFFVPHATVNRQVLIPVSRLRDGHAPILHETTHALLTPPQGRRPLAWLTEGVAAYVAKSVSASSGIPEGDIFELGGVDELDNRCAAGLSSAQGTKVLPFIAAQGNLAALYGMEPAFPVRQTFYGCAASFTKYLVDRLGLDRVVDVLPEADPHKKLEQLSGLSMMALRSSWTTKIGAKASP